MQQCCNDHIPQLKYKIQIRIVCGGNVCPTLAIIVYLLLFVSSFVVFKEKVCMKSKLRKYLSQFLKSKCYKLCIFEYIQVKL